MIPIPPEQWGRDHYTTIAYAFHRVGKTLERERLRPDSERYPTRLQGGVTRPDHDDLDCLRDAQAAGLGVLVPRGASDHAFVFTPEGLHLACWLVLSIDSRAITSATLTWTQALAGSGANPSPADLPILPGLPDQDEGPSRDSAKSVLLFRRVPVFHDGLGTSLWASDGVTDVEAAALFALLVEEGHVRPGGRAPYVFSDGPNLGVFESLRSVPRAHLKIEPVEPALSSETP